MTMTKSERYIAFLLTYLPRLAATAVYSAGENVPHRAGPLHAAQRLAAKRAGAYLEFGVYKGASISSAARRYPTRRFYGFDSFEGFPQDNRVDWAQDFSVPSLPSVPENVTLLKGWFTNTLPSFLDKLDEPIAMVHVDCDIYSSTVDVFSLLHTHNHLAPGLIIAFDEIINYRDFLWNEMLALFEMLELTGLGLDWIGVNQKVRLVDETLTLLIDNIFPSWKDDLQNGYWQQASLVLTANPLDFSLAHNSHVRSRITKLAEQFASLTSDRQARQEKATAS